MSDSVIIHLPSLFPSSFHVRVPHSIGDKHTKSFQGKRGEGNSGAAGCYLYMCTHACGTPSASVSVSPRLISPAAECAHAVNYIHRHWLQSLEFTNAELGGSERSVLSRLTIFSILSFSLPLLVVCGYLFFSSFFLSFIFLRRSVLLSLFSSLISIVHAPTSLRLTHRNSPPGARLLIHTCVHIYIPASSDFPSTISVAIAVFLCHACIMSCNLHTHITTLPPFLRVEGSSRPHFHFHQPFNACCPSSYLHIIYTTYMHLYNGPSCPRRFPLPAPDSDSDLRLKSDSLNCARQK